MEVYLDQSWYQEPIYIYIYIYKTYTIKVVISLLVDLLCINTNTLLQFYIVSESCFFLCRLVHQWMTFWTLWVLKSILLLFKQRKYEDFSCFLCFAKFSTIFVVFYLYFQAWLNFTFWFLQVDMTALVHMTDDDLKALGIPMVNPMKLGPQHM